MRTSPRLFTVSRLEAVRRVIKSYRPHTVVFVTTALPYTSDFSSLLVSLSLSLPLPPSTFLQDTAGACIVRAIGKNSEIPVSRRVGALTFASRGTSCWPPLRISSRIDFSLQPCPHPARRIMCHYFFLLREPGESLCDKQTVVSLFPSRGERKSEYYAVRLYTWQLMKSRGAGDDGLLARILFAVGRE